MSIKEQHLLIKFLCLEVLSKINLLTMIKNILAIGAHPDDIEIGCGGTLQKQISYGDNVYALVMSNGDLGNHDHHRGECMKSLMKLGLKEDHIFFGNFRDGFIPDNGESVALIERYIKKYKIEKVYTHDHNDRHQDHRNVSWAVSSAARNVPEIYLFQGPSTSTGFEPHYFIELTKKQLNKKISCLKEYSSQTKKGIVNTHWIEDLAVTNGNFGNVKLAEAFAINHISRVDEHV